MSYDTRFDILLIELAAISHGEAVTRRGKGDFGPPIFRASSIRVFRRIFHGWTKVRPSMIGCGFK